MYDELWKLAETFTRSWVLQQNVAQDWKRGYADVGFSFDHISGRCLENAVNEQGIR